MSERDGVMHATDREGAGALFRPDTQRRGAGCVQLTCSRTHARLATRGVATVYARSSDTRGVAAGGGVSAVLQMQVERGSARRTLLGWTEIEQRGGAANSPLLRVGRRVGLSVIRVSCAL